MKSYIIIGILFISVHGFAQNDPDNIGIEKFNVGLEYYQNGQLDSALIVWTEIVEKKIGVTNDIYGSTFFNIPTIYWQLKDYDKAKEWYKKVLDSDLKDSDETGSLMEPHTNYKHKSAVALAGLYQIDSNFTEVLNWLNLADTVYRYWGFEGSATNVSKRQAYLLDWKTDVLLKLDRTNQAIRVIIIELICSDRLESFFDNSADMLLTLIDNDAFKSDFDSAIDQLNIVERDTNNWIVSFELYGLTYLIPISNTYPDRNLPHYWRTYFIDKNSTPSKKKTIEYIRSRSFYNRLRK